MSSDYWHRRAEAAEAAMDIVQDEASRRLGRIGRAMMAAQSTLTKEAARILGNYVRRYGMPREEAMEALRQPVSHAEWQRLRAQVATMPEGREKRVLLAQMSSGAYRYRITRAEALRANIAIETAKVTQTVVNETTGQLKWTAAEAYQRCMFDTQLEQGVGFADPDMQGALEAVGAHWAGTNYSGRCWDNRERLATRLEEIIPAAMLSGKSNARLSREIMDEFAVGFRQAERLVRTETSYVAGQSRKKAYDNAGCKQYRYLTALDRRTCELCGPLDRRLYEVAKAETGLNYPPLHPNCRCTTAPVVQGREGASRYRRGRDAKGKGVLLPKDMTFAEWKAWQAAGCPKDAFAWLKGCRDGLKQPKKKTILMSEGHSKNPNEGDVNGITDLLRKDGSIKQRRYYGSNRKPRLDIDTDDHGYEQKHPMGAHAHDYTIDEAGSIKHNKQRPITYYELGMNGDILKLGGNVREVGDSKH